MITYNLQKKGNNSKLICISIINYPRNPDSQFKYSRK